MENDSILCYHEKHETFGKPDAIGEAAPTSNPVAGEGHDLVGSSSTRRFLRKLRFSMAAGVSAGRRKRAGLQSLSRASSKAFGTRKEALGEPFAERSCGVWVPYRSLDHATGSRSNSKVLWHSVSSQPPVASPDGAGMELSKARTPGSGEGRGGDRTLEAETIAGNKKKPPHLEPIWPFSMRVGLCSSPLFVGPGRREDRLRSCVISIEESGFRLLRPLLSRPSGDMWRFTADFRGRISIPLMWQPFCAISCDTFVVMSSSCGTRPASIEGSLFGTSVIATKGFMWNGSPDMPPNLIRWNLCGPRQSGDWPIAPQKEQRNLSEWLTALPDVSNVLNASSGRASGPLHYPGKDNMFSINYA